MLVNLNKRKEGLKRNGIHIDGKDYSVHFKSTISCLFKCFPGQLFLSTPSEWVFDNATRILELLSDI